MDVKLLSYFTLFLTTCNNAKIPLPELSLAEKIKDPAERFVSTLLRIRSPNKSVANVVGVLGSTGGVAASISTINGINICDVRGQEICFITTIQ